MGYYKDLYTKAQEAGITFQVDIDKFVQVNEVTDCQALWKRYNCAGCTHRNDPNCPVCAEYGPRE